MEEYISKIDAVNAVEHANGNMTWAERDDCKKRLGELPSADVVRVIRCGQCKYWQDNDGDYGYCYAKDGHGFGHTWGKNDFCSYGKTR